MRDAVALVSAARQPNAGLCLDIWHHTRAGSDWRALGDLDPDLITNVQLDDGTAVATTDDYKFETIHQRLCPGDGEFEIDAFLDATAGVAPAAPISVEVLSDELWKLDPVEIGRIVGEKSRARIERWADETERSR